MIRASHHIEAFGLFRPVQRITIFGTIVFLFVSVVVTGTVVSQDIASKNPMANIFTVSNSNDAGPGSLRDAIAMANAMGNTDQFTPDLIEFVISGVGPHTIQVVTPLPIITDPVFIDGFTQSGAIPDTNGPGQPFNGVLQIVLDGSLEPAGSGLQLYTDNSTIRGLVINQFYLDGVAMWTVGSTGNLLTECFIGTDATGTVMLGNGRNIGGESLGVRVGGGANFNTVQRNVISGNVQSGLSLDNNGNNNLIVDNAIGTDPTGLFAVPNGADGVRVQSGAFSNTIQSNLISGNTSSGITSFGGANSNIYDDNIIGANLSGTTAIPNQLYGMSIFGDNGDVITNNLISGNLLDGIQAGESGLIITDNLIGPDETGSQFIGNQVSALRLTSGGHTIERNILAGSGNAGIGIRGAITNVVIRNNAIGTDATGSSMIGLFRKGILVEIGPQSNILIDSNIVAGSEANGIEVQGIDILGVTITRNSIFNNGSVGIDLITGAVGSGFSPNDPGDADLGTNNLQNFPDIERAEINGSGNLTFDFLVDSVPGNSTYPLVVEFFIADADNQEGQTYLGMGIYLVGEAGNLASIVLGNAVALGVTDTSQFVATATDAAGNTSEFSLPAALVTGDILALEALYNSTGGDNWTDNTNWMTSAPVETWFGITTVSGQVTELQLGTNNLVGVLPPDLGNLSNLTFLELSDNQLTGAIPADLGNLSNLTFLELSGNQLTGAIPANLGILSNLTFLNLTFNQLTGAIPPELGNLSSLFFLDLSFNQLTGAIPADLGNLSSLSNLLLEENQLTGVIPAELGNLSSLTGLYLDRNQLTGAIPTELANLTSLSELHLVGNQLTGAIPAELGNLTSLVRLFLDGNQLTGTIPSELGDLPVLTTLLLADNQLTGVIPAELGDLASLKFLFLNRNQLTGAIPAELGSLGSLVNLKLQENQLNGAVPKSFGNLINLGSLDVTQNGLVDLPDLSVLTDLTLFEVANNQFTFEDLEPNINVPGFNYAPQSPFGGASFLSVIEEQDLTISFAVGGSANQYQWLLDGQAIDGANSTEYSIVSVGQNDAGEYTLEVTNPLVPGLTLLSHPITVTLTLVVPNDRLALEALYNSTDGGSWVNNTNWMTGNPVDTWYGLTVSNGRVTGIDLRSNNLIGSFPPEWINLINQEGALSELESLRLSTDFSISGPANQLIGAIPVEFGNLRSLVVLDLHRTQLTGEIPSELGNLSLLARMYLSNNQLSGPIPVELGNLGSLFELSLFNNQLTGLIPSELGILSNLTILNVQGNQLTGAIPTSLGNLTSLSWMDLSENQLSGVIPSELGELSTLTRLDLSFNQISGPIPSEIGNLKGLTYLDLSLTGLTGTIPVEFGNLTNLTFLGLHFTQLTGSIPPELGNLTNLFFLGLYSNQHTGSIPSELGNLVGLTDLSLFGNQLSGTIPPELGNLVGLTILLLNNNQLSGTIPSELGNLINLTTLLLSRNQLVGAVPASFVNLTNLSTFNISQNRLSDLPDLSSLGTVTSFLVQDNQFTFEDLEANASLAGAVYSPQARIGSASTRTVIEQGLITISFATPGTSNQYQWLKNGAPINGANSNEYSILSVSFSDAGVYTLRVTNSLVPELTLESESITIVVDELIIVVTEPTEVVASAGDDVPVSASLPDNYQPEQRELCYRRTAESEFQCIPLAQIGGNDTGQIPSEFVTERGVEYYFQFTLGGDVTTIPDGGASNPFQLRVNVTEVQAGGAFTPSTYRMVSVPVELESPQIESVLDEYGPYDPAVWRLYRWNATTQELREHPNTGVSFTPCVAFWLITHDGPGFQTGIGISIDPLSQCGSSILSIKPGWNQFGIPRAYSIDWEDVQGIGNLDGPVHFNASVAGSDPYSYNVSTLLPWDGYWVNNPGTQDVEVTFPSIESTGKRGKQGSELAFLSKSEYALQLIASIPERELVDRHNYLGLSTEASDENDRLDFAEAPGIGSFVRLSLIENEDRLAGNFKAFNPEGATWHFEVAAEVAGGLSRGGEYVHVEINELLQRPHGQDIFILDVDEGRRVRPTKNAFSVTLTYERPLRHFQIIVGTSDFAAAVSDGMALVPQSFALEQNYPNPFNPMTQIRYQLSEPAHVVLELFNSLGQRVNVLVNSNQEAGWYEVTWDSRDQSSKRAASGVYFYRLRTNDVVLSRPMILLK